MIPNGAWFDNCHTSTYFRMLPKETMFFVPPPPKLEIQSLTGADGELDYSEEVDGKIHYDNRRGSFEFLVRSGADYMFYYKRALAFFDGRERTCVLDDEPEVEYVGRFWVNTWKSYEAYSLIVIDYDVEPTRYGRSDILPADWLWDEVNFVNDDILYYWSFDLDGEKWRTLYNPKRVNATPSFLVSSDVTVNYAGTDYTITASNPTPGFTLPRGPNLLKFTGSGTVGIQYNYD